MLHYITDAIDILSNRKQALARFEKSSFSQAYHFFTFWTVVSVFCGMAASYLIQEVFGTAAALPPELMFLGSVSILFFGLLELLASLIGVFVIVGILHLFVMLFKGRQGYLETMKAHIYAGTPIYMVALFSFLAVIPFIGTGLLAMISVLASIFSLVLYYHALTLYQKMSAKQAIRAIIAPLILLAAVVVLLVITAVLVFGASFLMLAINGGM